MVNAKNVFEALPHINEIWITKDGHFHLHPNNGGKKYVRGEEEEKKIKTLPVEAVKK
ncbi:MAG TPA: hypothetical protein VN722_08510 [Hanamia sp.]|nr:hypothetical protein [Hanamia sp.]